jgi:flagellar protein FlaG
MPLTRRLRPSSLNLRRPRLRSKGRSKERIWNRLCREYVKCSRRQTPDWSLAVDPDLDRVVVKVMDGDSGTVIRQIPQQEVIDLAKRLETPTGLLLHHKV